VLALEARKTGRFRFLNPSYCALDMIRPPPCSDLCALFQSSRYAISVQCKPYPSPPSSFSFKDYYWISYGFVLKVQRASAKRLSFLSSCLLLLNENQTIWWASASYKEIHIELRTTSFPQKGTAVQLSNAVYSHFLSTDPSPQA